MSSRASRFLTSVAQAFSTMSLYKEGHPSRERAQASVGDRLQELQETHPTCHFVFLGEDIVLDNRPLRDLQSWHWGSRLAKAGIQWLEVTGPVGRDELELFLETAYGCLSGRPPDTSEARTTRPSHLRWGSVAIRSDEAKGSSANPLVTATLGFRLTEEVGAVDWLHRELKEGRALHLMEAEGIIRSLSVAMHGGQTFMIPLLRLKRFDQYTTTHAMNVSVLAMSLAEFIGLSPKEVRAFGIAGLLHDVGKVSVPEEILNKAGKLSESERLVMNRHPVEGAKLILETENQLELAATVAYEHHIKLNGGGYPTFTYPRVCHRASELVHVCDVFDALRSERPYRSAWPTDQVLTYIEQRAGTEFEPELARAFVQMMRTWERQVLYVEDPAGTKPEAASSDEAPAAALPELDIEDDDVSWD